MSAYLPVCEDLTISIQIYHSLFPRFTMRNESCDDTMDPCVQAIKKGTNEPFYHWISEAGTSIFEFGQVHNCKQSISQKQEQIGKQCSSRWDGSLLAIYLDLHCLQMSPFRTTWS